MREEFDLEAIRSELKERLAVIEQRTSRIDADLRRAGHPDSEEQAQESQNDEVLEGLDEQGREEIGKIRAALGRIEAGTYGSCSSCGEPIPIKRLRVMPLAMQCVACAG